MQSLPQLIDAVRARTPARILAGRAGDGYRTETLLSLRRDHATARDAVHAELDLLRDLGPLVEPFSLFEVRTVAKTKTEFLRFPQRGRMLSEVGRKDVQQRCPAAANVQVLIGDGLSATAVGAQLPQLLPRLADETLQRGWTFGQPFVVRHCRVGLLNEIGELLSAKVVVLLIGERPGLATAESLSAYLAFRPRLGHTDADRNLVSNIHSQGVPVPDATRRILDLASQMISRQSSGVAIKETGLGLARDKALCNTPVPQ